MPFIRQDSAKAIGQRQSRETLVALAKRREQFSFHELFMFSTNRCGGAWLGRGIEVASYGLQLPRDLRQRVEDGFKMVDGDNALSRC